MTGIAVSMPDASSYAPVDPGHARRQERFAVEIAVDPADLAGLAVPLPLRKVAADRLRCEWIAEPNAWTGGREVRVEIVVPCLLDGEACDFVAARLGRDELAAGARLSARLLADPRQVVASIDRDGQRLLTAVMQRPENASETPRREAAAGLIAPRCQLRQVADADGGIGLCQLTGASPGRARILSADSGPVRLHLIPPVAADAPLPMPRRVLGARHVLALVSGQRRRLLADYLRPERDWRPGATARRQLAS